MANKSNTECLISIEIEGQNTAFLKPDVEQERRIAIYDILEENHFILKGDKLPGPYHLCLKFLENQLILHLSTGTSSSIREIALSMTPFRSLMKNYLAVCQNYTEAIRKAPRARIEAIDMGRRSLHNEASELLCELLKSDVEIDFDTARRLFTLIYVLHTKR